MNDELKHCLCGGEPIERIGYGFDTLLCGISVGSNIGTYIYCNRCGKRTNSFRVPLDAYEAWNRMITDG